MSSNQTPEQLLEALRSAAQDMGISARKLASMLEIERALAWQERPERVRPVPDENKQREMSEAMAERLPIHPEGAPRVRAREALEAAKTDAAVIAARKIFRALPRDKDVVVSTSLGWQVVRVFRVEDAPKPAPIRRKLALAEAAEREALERYAQVELAHARHTILKRTPKADADALRRAGALADKRTARVRLLRRALHTAEAAHTAGNKMIVKVGDVRLTLRPQSMSNRVARLAQEIPTRQDVHPFRHVRPIRHKPPVPYGYVSHPEACYLLYVDMMEQLARKQEREEKAAEARDAMYRALAEEMAREALEREQHAAALRSASNAREAAALKEKRRRNKAKR